MSRSGSRRQRSTITGFWKAWGKRRVRVRADAADLVRDYADQAYGIAERMAYVERIGRLISPALPPGHWNRVRREVKRTATRPPR